MTEKHFKGNGFDFKLVESSNVKSRGNCIMFEFAAGSWTS